MSLDNSIGFSFSGKSESQDISSPSSTEESYERLIRRRRVVPPASEGKDETNQLKGPRMGQRRLVIKDNNEDNSD